MPTSTLIVGLASKAVMVPGLLSALRAAPGLFYCVDGIGNSWAQPARPRVGRSPSSVALFAKLTAEHLATRAALERALLASRVAFVHRPASDDYAASLGEVTRVDGTTKADSLDALLDALLDRGGELMTAAEIVKCAERAQASSIRRRALWYGDDPPGVFSVLSDGNWQIDDARLAPKKALMRATLTQECRDVALVRALLASTAQYLGYDCEVACSVAGAPWGPAMRCNSDALAAALDGLLISRDA